MTIKESLFSTGVSGSSHEFQEIAIHQMDPAIREVVVKLNSLSFIEQTLVSCSGHTPPWWKGGNSKEGYLCIIYNWDQKNKDKSLAFHDLISKIEVFTKKGNGKFVTRGGLSHYSFFTKSVVYETKCYPKIKSIILKEIWEAVDELIHNFN